MQGEEVGADGEDEGATTIKEDKIIFKGAPISKPITNSQEPLTKIIKTTITIILEMIKIIKGTGIIHKITQTETTRIIIIGENKGTTLSLMTIKTAIDQDSIKIIIETFKIIMDTIPMTSIIMILFNKNISRNHNTPETIVNLTIKIETTTKVLFKLPME